MHFNKREPKHSLSRPIYAYLNTNVHINKLLPFQGNFTDNIKYRTHTTIRWQENSNYELSYKTPQPTKIAKAPQFAPKGFYCKWNPFNLGRTHFSQEK